MKVSLNVIAPQVTLKFNYRGTDYNISTKNVSANNVEWSDAEIAAAMNAQGITYANLSDEYFWFIADIDEYHEREDLGPERAILPGSFVEIDSALDQGIYGKIDLTSIIPVFNYADNDQGDFYRKVQWRYNVSPNTAAFILDSQLAWLHQVGTNPNQLVQSNAKTLYQHPPQPFISELARFGFTQDFGEITNGENSYYLEFSTGYSINPFNSLVSYIFLLDSFIPYGATFPTEQEALDDAIERLNNLLGSYVSATEISTEAVSIGGVPSLWGPTITEIRVWK